MGGWGEELPDLIFLVINSGILTHDLVGLAKSSLWIKKILEIPWIPSSTKEGGPEAIQKSMDEIFLQINQTSDPDKIYHHLCASFNDIIPSLASAFGSLVSVFIPDDMGIARFSITNAVALAGTVAGDQAYNFIKTVYTHIPLHQREVLEDPKKLKAFLVHILSYVTNLFPTKKEGFFTKLKKNAERLTIGEAAELGSILTNPLTIPAAAIAQAANLTASFGTTGQMVIDLIDKLVIPNIDRFVALTQKILPLTFAAVYLLSKCYGSSLEKAAAEEKAGKTGGKSKIMSVPEILSLLSNPKIMADLEKELKNPEVAASISKSLHS